MNAPPKYDDFGKPLIRSMISAQMWELLENDPTAFKHEVRKFFARGYQGFTVVSADPEHRIIWIRDDRERRI